RLPACDSPFPYTTLFRSRAIIPLEMLSVLFEYSSREAAFPVKGPAVGLFADQEIRLIDGPLFVGEEYVLRREIAALAESKRTERSEEHTSELQSRENLVC